MNLYVDVIRAYTVTLIIKNKTKSIRDSGSKEDEADTVYLLAKELAYDVVTGQTDKLSAALAKTSGKDIVQFAKAVEISHSKIDDKICKTKDKPSGGSGAHYGVYGERTEDSSTWLRAQCGAAGDNSKSNSTPQVLKDFVKEALKGDGSKNWPTSTGLRAVNNDNANAVAKDLVEKLSSDEKTIVAGLLAKTIEGGDN
ncbi:putative p44-3 outer membrane protein, silent [Anaplasma phagocytophilum str. ApMUC09]|uniref:Putative p44-3 outer membrane protein, silent n=1 Tax=Anaplasma phagocytophilum str. ApMUC09 TaxID=1359152 RepID=A0A0F3NBP0_ANAPH|nr:putative p44-3 outer membrane protein, silent [Anaplasma phagocytophilum str. ApMUC09]SCV65801.1 hypothetical protein ANAPH2_01381 [Anaplasma phagocytophilum]